MKQLMVASYYGIRQEEAITKLAGNPTHDQPTKRARKTKTEEETPTEHQEQPIPEN
jgi:hypothetical protein